MNTPDRPAAPTASSVAAWVTAVIAVLVVVFPVVFGVGFPYSLGAFEVTVFLLFIVAAFWLQLSTRSLLVVFWLCLGFMLHVLALDGDFGALGFRGSCLTDGPHPSGIDTVAAFDSFRRGLAYVVVFLLVRHVSASARNASVLFSAVAASAAILLVLGLMAPQDSKNILWFYAVPTHDRDWLSSSVNSLLTDLWGYARTYEYHGIPLTLDELQVSRKPVGPIFNGNQYAAAIGVSFPVLLAWLGERLATRSRIRPGYVLLPLAIFTCIVVYLVTDSRGGLLAMSVSLAGFFVIRRNGQLAVPFVSLVILCAMAICIFVPLLRVSGEIPLLGGRATIWLQTVRVFLEQPLIGIGIGNLADLRLGYGNTPPVVWYAAHNVFLQFLTEVGIVGTVWIIAAIWILGPNDSETNTFGLGGRRESLHAAIYFVLIHSALDYSIAMPVSAMLSAVITGLAFGLSRNRIAAPTAGRVTLAALLRQLPIPILAVFLVYSSIESAFSQQRLWKRRDLVALQLSTMGSATGLPELRSLLTQDQRWCGHLPPSKDQLQSLAIAHIVLSENGSSAPEIAVDAYLSIHRSIGRQDEQLDRTKRFRAEQ